MADESCEITEATCSNMKEGEVYTCESCGLEIQVLKECTECCCSTEFICCEKPMTLKKWIIHGPEKTMKNSIFFWLKIPVRNIEPYFQIELKEHSKTGRVLIKSALTCIGSLMWESWTVIERTALETGFHWPLHYKRYNLWENGRGIGDWKEECYLPCSCLQPYICSSSHFWHTGEHSQYSCFYSLAHSCWYSTFIRTRWFSGAWVQR